MPKKKQTSPYFTFPEEFKIQCSCNSKKNVFYVCTYEKCEKCGLICPLCMFYKHSTHANYCIPIQVYKIEKLRPDRIQYLKQLKEYLIDKKEEITGIIDSQIQLIEDLENDNTLENLFNHNIFPKYSNPPKIQTEHIIKNKIFFENINAAVQEQIKNLLLIIEEMIFKLKNYFLNGKLVQICDNQLTTFDEFNPDESCKFKFTFKSKEPFVLAGVGYSFKMCEHLKLDGTISIQEVESKEYLLTEMEISSNQLKFSAFPDLTVVHFEPLKISKGIEYLVTFDYKAKSLFFSTKTIWLGNLKYNSMQFNISAGNQDTKKYVSHLWIN